MKRIASVLSLIVVLVMLSGCAVQNDLSAVPSDVQTNVEEPATKAETEVDSASDKSDAEEDVSVEALFEELTQDESSEEETVVEDTEVEEEIEEQPIETIVYITDTGTKYHDYGCRYLKKSCYSISLSEAIDSNYEPCKVCTPPR